MNSECQRLKTVNPINWQDVRKVLVIRLRSIGDTVLTTPSLISLRRFLPDAQIDVLLEDWVAPVLDGYDGVDNVLSVSKKPKDRIKLARQIRLEKYDVVFNLHGGTTSTFLMRATGAKHRVGYKGYRHSFLHNHLLSSAEDYWDREKNHSAEQQLALFGFVGISIEDKPKTVLNVLQKNKTKIDFLLNSNDVGAGEIALIHPAAAFASKQWDAENFAKVIEMLADRNVFSVVVTAPNEKSIIDKLLKKTSTNFLAFSDLILPEVTALAKRSIVFVGNDSGIAHMAAAVGTPSVVIFGSSNRDHWRPWTDARNEIVFEEMSCQPCYGKTCEEFDEPKCILNVRVGNVVAAIEKVLKKQT